MSAFLCCCCWIAAQLTVFCCLCQLLLPSKNTVKQDIGYQKRLTSISTPVTSEQWVERTFWMMWLVSAFPLNLQIQHKLTHGQRCSMGKMWNVLLLDLRPPSLGPWWSPAPRSASTLSPASSSASPPAEPPGIWSSSPPLLPSAGRWRLKILGKKKIYAFLWYWHNAGSHQNIKTGVQYMTDIFYEYLDEFSSSMYLTIPFRQHLVNNFTFLCFYI